MLFRSGEAASFKEKMDQLMKSRETLTMKTLETKLLITEKKKEVKLAKVEADTLQTYLLFLMLLACFTPILICFIHTSCTFYAFSGTNLLTRCRSASSCFLLFLVSEKLHRKYSRNGTGRKPKFLFFPTRRRSPEQRRRRATRQPHLP